MAGNWLVLGDKYAQDMIYNILQLQLWNNYVLDMVVLGDKYVLDLIDNILQLQLGNNYVPDMSGNMLVLGDKYALDLIDNMLELQLRNNYVIDMASNMVALGDKYALDLIDNILQLQLGNKYVIDMASNMVVLWDKYALDLIDNILQLQLGNNYVLDMAGNMVVLGDKYALDLIDNMLELQLGNNYVIDITVNMVVLGDKYALDLIDNMLELQLGNNYVIDMAGNMVVLGNKYALDLIDNILQLQLGNNYVIDMAGNMVVLGNKYALDLIDNILQLQLVNNYVLDMAGNMVVLGDKYALDLIDNMLELQLGNNYVLDMAGNMVVLGDKYALDLIDNILQLQLGNNYVLDMAGNVVVLGDKYALDLIDNMLELQLGNNYVLDIADPPEDPFLEIDGKKLHSQATISVKELTLLSVKCVARYAVPPVQQIHWSLDTTNISSNSELLVEFLPEENTYVSWSVVTFNVTRTFHKKDLVCYVHHELWPQAVAVSASLDVLYVPSFSISREPPFGFPVVEGMSVSLQCDIDANPPSVAKWLKDEGSSPLASSVDGILNFTSISRHNSGWYKCTTENQFGSFSSFGYFLNVRYGAEIVQQPPDVLEADAGDPFRLECKADGKPPPSYCWTRIRENSRLEGVSIEKDLLLDTVLYSDAGQYKCIASNTIGRRLYTAQTKDINVKVKGRPEVDPVNKTLNAIAGKSAKLFVRFCGNPRPYRAIWILRHLALSPGDTILPYIAHNATVSVCVCVFVCHYQFVI
ncbi:titin-like [Limulus polyphemus]|uniref:Titin-like n=1 Tax=Limulus polyphemus TaxID=6850 RepID=A0ABM1TLG0_LIMPO|nr:titin-like [Limulus polyphemus]